MSATEYEDETYLLIVLLRWRGALLVTILLLGRSIAGILLLRWWSAELVSKFRRTRASLEPTTDSTVGVGTAVEEEDHIHHRYNLHLDMPTCWSLEVM